jgi:hypothetical protein
LIAICRIRPQPVYRRDAFENGLRAAGYRLVENGTPNGPQDLLVIWNRYGAFEQQANAWEQQGGTVLVAENGYLGADSEGRQYYALSAHGHNGSGWFPIGDDDRFAKLGIPLKPWRTGGTEIVVRGQRGIGTKLMASPPNWHQHAAARIRKMSERPIRVVPHPGNVNDRRGVEHLADAWALVVWSSAMGVYALTEGIPVFYGAPHWICHEAAWPFNDWLTGQGPPPLALQGRVPDFRPQAMHRMAWGQWAVTEIESGEPFALYRDELLAKAAA